MTTTIEQARQLLDRLPADATWERITYAFAVRASVERGFAEVDEGDGIPNDEVWKEIDGWLASSGRPNRKKTSKSTSRELQATP